MTGSTLGGAQLVRLPQKGDGVQLVYNSTHMLGFGSAGQVYAGGVESEVHQGYYTLAIKVLDLAQRTQVLWSRELQCSNRF